MSRRAAIHELIDGLPDEATEEVERLLLDYRAGRFARMLAEAPEDDEPWTEEDVARIDRLESEAGQLPTYSTTQVRAMMAEWARAAR